MWRLFKQTVPWRYFFKALITRHVILYFFISSSLFLGHYIYMCISIYTYICTYIHTYICVCTYTCVYVHMHIFKSVLFFCICPGFFYFPFILSSVDWSHVYWDADHSAPVDSVLMKLLRSVKLSICINAFRNKVSVASRCLNLNIWILLLFDLIVSMTSVTMRLT